MSISLVSHLKQREKSGIYYFRYVIPEKLRGLLGKREIVVSLKTREPAKARELAYYLTFQTVCKINALMAYNPLNFDPNDPSTFPSQNDSPSVKKYEIDFNNRVFKTTDAEDHARALELVNAFSKIPPPPPQQIQQIQAQKEAEPEHTITMTNALIAFEKTLRNEKTRLDYSAVINHFIQYVGNQEVHKIRGFEVVNWKSKLLEKNKPVTVDKKICALQSFFTYCQKHDYIIESKTLPTVGKLCFSKDEREDESEGAEAFTIQELNQIFDENNYLKYVKLKNNKIPNARFWFPLIGIYTGLRIEEIGQLTKNDIKNENDVWYFDINKNNGKKLKTKASVRKIPIHQKLIEIGFLEYVQKLETTSIWPELKKLKNGYGNSTSKAFILYLERLKIRKSNTDRTKVFHSCRDTFNNYAEKLNSNIKDSVRYSLMGHTKKDVNEKNYLAVKNVETLKFEGIDLIKFEEKINGIEHILTINLKFN